MELKVKRNAFLLEILDLPIQECRNRGCVFLFNFDEIFMNKIGAFF